MEQHSHRLERFFKDSIHIGDETWLVFEREQYYQGSSEDAVKVSIVDSFNNTTTVIAIFFSGKWIMSAPYHSQIFWKYAKLHKLSIYRILKRLTISMRELQSLKLEWNCIKRRFYFSILKTTRKLKHFNPLKLKL